jgi:hypothetical protein
MPRDELMKRRELIRHLPNHGRRFAREGKEHTIFANRDSTNSAAVPRHRELGFKVTRAICKELKIPFP